MQMNRLILIVIIVVLVIGGLMFVQSQQTVPTTNLNPTQPPTENPETNPETTEQTGEVKEFTVSTENFSFTPSTMTVNQGDKVRITVNNTGGVHDLTIDEFNVKTQMLDDGASETVEFTADKTGTFEYYCSVGNHRAMGMKGTLTVQ